MIEWLINNYQIIITLITIPITWYTKERYFTKRDLKDRDVNIESNQSEIVSKNLELYQRMLDDIEKRYEEKIFKSDREKEQLEQIIKELNIIIDELKQALLESKDLNHELELKSRKFVNEIINLKARLKEYED